MSKLANGPLVRLPFYAKASLVIMGLFFLLSMMALGKSIIVPLLLSIVLSILLSTLVDFLEEKKIDRVVSIWISLFIAAFVCALILIWVISQFNSFIDRLPEMNEKFDVIQGHFAEWFSENFGVAERKTNQWIDSARADFTTLSAERIGDTISMLGSAVIIMILIPVYIFLMLYYQPLIIDFIHKFVGDGHSHDVRAVLGQTKSLLKAYFLGLLIELVIVSILNSIGLMILDVESAILIGVLGGFLNMIPYIGGIIMLALSMLMAMLSNPDPSIAVYAALMFFVIQVIDNYFLIPKIIGSRVKINALVAVVAVIAGGAIWGIAGMFIALPLTAILKVIFDRIEPLKPWGFLFGDTMPPVKLKFRRKKAAS
ncbi:MAG TPA: AI-2E family transporter, partial [Saprospiraceae bacterium]|nr:AI-2E family transporter [Saprospiraceae bacterium]